MILVDPKNSFDPYERAKTCQYRDFKDFVKEVMEKANLCYKRNGNFFTITDGYNHLLHTPVFILLEITTFIFLFFQFFQFQFFS